MYELGTSKNSIGIYHTFVVPKKHSHGRSEMSDRQWISSEIMIFLRSFENRWIIFFSSFISTNWQFSFVRVDEIQNLVLFKILWQHWNHYEKRIFDRGFELDNHHMWVHQKSSKLHDSVHHEQLSVLIKAFMFFKVTCAEYRE